MRVVLSCNLGNRKKLWKTSLVKFIDLLMRDAKCVYHDNFGAKSEVKGELHSNYIFFISP